MNPQILNNAADKFFANTHKYHKCFVPRPQPIDYVLHFFNNANSLKFVDVGAYDGVTWSNSFVLEKYLQWDGICIEPHPESFKELVNERDAQCLNICAAAANKDVTYRQVKGEADVLSGIVDQFCDDHKNRIQDEISAHNSSYEDITIPAKTLTSILKDKGFSSVDYLSIDAEGGEFEILSGLDFNQYSPKLISVEEECKEQKRNTDQQAEDLLLSCGYEKQQKVCGDLFYSLCEP